MLTRGMCLASRNTPPRRGLGGTRTGGGTSSLDRVASFSVRRFRGLDREAHFLSQRAANETAHAMGLPFGSCHEVLQGDSVGPLEQFHNLGRFAAPAGCGTPGAMSPFAGLVVGPNTGRLWRMVRGKILDGLPDSGDGCQPARELFDGFLAGQSVPDLNQPGARPVLSQAAQFFRTGEPLGLRVVFCLLGRTEGGGVVVRVDCKGRHWADSPFGG